MKVLLMLRYFLVFFILFVLCATSTLSLAKTPITNIEKKLSDLEKKMMVD